MPERLGKAGRGKGSFIFLTAWSQGLGTTRIDFPSVCIELWEVQPDVWSSQGSPERIPPCCLPPSPSIVQPLWAAGPPVAKQIFFRLLTKTSSIPHCTEDQ